MHRLLINLMSIIKYLLQETLFLTIHQKKVFVKELRSYLKKNITGLIVIPGDTALAVSRALNDLGKKIPDDISLVTLEYAGVCENWYPPLTSLCRDYPRICTTALDLIVNWLNHKTVNDVFIPSELIYRDSIKNIKVFLLRNIIILV